MSANKKRKFSCGDNEEFTDDDVYQEMNHVNSRLISLARKILKVDHQYFVDHSEMVNEFIGNIELFMNNINSHRRGVASQLLNTDIISSVYQFLDTEQLVNSCQLVSKMWRESLRKSFLVIRLGMNLGSKDKLDADLVGRMFKFEFVNNITSLTLKRPGMDTFLKINQENSKLSNLKSLAILGSDAGVRSVDYLMESEGLYSLTELSFANSPKFDQRQLLRILTGTLGSNITSLDLSGISLSEHFFKTISTSTIQTKLVNLKLVANLKHENRNGLAILLASVAPTLQFLNLSGTFLEPSILNSMLKLSKLNTLILTGCKITTPFSILLFNYENLKTLKINSLTIPHLFEIGMEKLQYFETCLTDLDISNNPIFYLHFLVSKSPKLRTLRMEHLSVLENDITDILNNPSFSNLEYLDISAWPTDAFAPTMNLIFTSPYFSNLKTLICKNVCGVLDANVLQNCKTLTNLRQVVFDPLTFSTGVADLLTNPTFKNLV